MFQKICNYWWRRFKWLFRGTKWKSITILSKNLCKEKLIIKKIGYEGLNEEEEKRGKRTWLCIKIIKKFFYLLENLSGEEKNHICLKE